MPKKAKVSPETEWGRKMVRLRWEKGGVTEAHRQAARENGKLGGRPKQAQPAAK
jgi:hypothetical protein